MLEYIATFCAGAFVEGVSVFWVHYSERGKASVSALFSCLGAAMFVFGVDKSLRDHWLEVLFVLGYGAGSYLAIKIKDRLRHAN